MLKSVIFLSLVLCFSVDGTQPDTRIVGGEDAKLGEIPYIVSIQANGWPSCGGSIVNEKTILTAAHCIYNWDDEPELFSIQYGVVRINNNGPNIIPVKKIIMHEKYEHRNNYPNDIALLELDGKIKFGPNAQPVKLPKPLEDSGHNVEALLAGWGYERSYGQVQFLLQKVIQTIFTDKYCSDAESRYDSTIQLCAGVIGGGKGQCSGDSGGPLTVNGVQVGVVSWSVKPCASEGHPGIFAKVSYYRDWIKKHSGV